MKKTLLLLLFFVLTISINAQNIIYVAHDATGLNNGTSWDNAYNSLTTALENATEGTSTTPGSQIWIKKGTYQPSDFDIGASFEVGKSIAIYGSFEGMETAIDQRPIVNNDTTTISTFFDGKIGSANILTILTYPEATKFNILDGIKIANNSPNILSSHKPALHIRRGNIVINNCHFTNNTSIWGGAIYITSSLNTEETIITNSTFDNNYSGNGGAIYNSEGNIVLENVTFQSNAVLSNGGAIYNETGDIVMNNVTFEDNIADKIAGTLYSREGELTIDNSSFISNSSEEGVGAIHIDGGNQNVSIDNSNFTTNKGLIAGAFHFKNEGKNQIRTTNFESNETFALASVIHDTRSTELLIDQCTFKDNIATDEGSTIGTRSEKVTITRSTFDGGINPSTVGKGGAIHAENTTTTTINESTFLNNKAALGGAIFIDRIDNEPIISGCTFNSNKSTSTGGAIYYSATPQPLIFNNEFIKNSSDENGGAVYIRNNNEVIFTNNTFRENNATELGGAYYLDVREAITILHGEFSKNKAKSGGAIYTTSSSNDVFIDNIDFTENEASEDGGAIYVSPNRRLQVLGNSSFTKNKATRNGGSIYYNGGDTSFDNVVFTENTSHQGGAIYFSNLRKRDASFTNCSFIDNKATTNGGAMYTAFTDIELTSGEVSGNNATNGGAFFVEHGSIITDRSHISGNEASEMGAVFYLYDLDATAETYNSLIVGNRANNNSVLYTDDQVTLSPSKFANCTIANNITVQIIGTIIKFQEGHNAKIYNSIISGNICVFAVNHGTLRNNIMGNHYSVEFEQDIIKQIPMFVNPKVFDRPIPIAEPIGADTPAFKHNGFDYHLNDIIGIDTGNDRWVEDDFDMDLDGNPRISDNVDIGAYETSILNVDDIFTNNELNIKTLPNPIIDTVQLVTQKNIDQVELYSIQGELLKTVINQSEMSLQQYPTGIYILKVTTGDYSKNIKVLKK